MSGRASADVAVLLLAAGSLVLISPHVVAGVALQDGSISLDGSDWQFALLEDEPVSTNEVKPTGTITVPGAWDAQGWGNETDRLHRNWLGLGLYRKAVAVPEISTGSTLWLVVERPKRAVQVSIDGQPVGAQHVGYLTNLEIDITSIVVGKHRVTLDLLVDAVWGQKNVPPLGTCPFTLAQGCSAAAGDAQKGVPSSGDQMVGSVDLVLPWGAPGDWGGLYGHVYLAVRPRLTIGDVLVLTPGSPAPTGQVDLEVELARGSGTPRETDRCRVDIFERERPITVVGTAIGHFARERCIVSASVSSPSLWWPSRPALYTASIFLESTARVEAAVASVVHAANQSFGFRNLSVAGHNFLLNGEPIFLSGYGDDNIFPETYAPPLEREWYRRKFAFARSIGMVFVRYHSHVLPDECYEEADIAGVMLQSARPVGYAQYYLLPPQGHATPSGRQLLEVSFNASLKRIRNHPSHVAFSFLNEWVPDDGPREYSIGKELAPHSLFIAVDGVGGVGGCSAKDLDYCVVSYDIGHDMLEMADKYNTPRLNKPQLGHEFGNWNSFPMVQSLIEHFEANTSAVKPYWLYPAASQLQKLNLITEHERWAAVSGALFQETAKMEIESLRVTGNISGFDWWLIQDYYTGSNGLLDSFLRPKPGIADTPKALSSLQSLLNQTALLLMRPDGANGSALSTAYRGGQQLNTAIAISVYRPGMSPIDGAFLRWSLTVHEYDKASDGPLARVVASGSVNLSQPLPTGEVVLAANISHTFSAGALGTFPKDGRRAASAARVSLRAHLIDSQSDVCIANNSWLTTLYPEWVDGASDEFGFSLWTTSDLTDSCMFNNCQTLPSGRFGAPSQPELPAINESHRSVVLLTGPKIPLAAAQLLEAGASMVFVQSGSSDFWPSLPNRFKSAWWLGAPSDSNCGTVAYTELDSCRNVTAGMIGPDGFGTERDAWLDRSWHGLVNGAQALDLAKLPAQPQVLIRALDIAGAGPRSKALLTAFTAGHGTVFVTGLNILQVFTSQSATDYLPDRAWLLFSLLRYAGVAHAVPEEKLPLAQQVTCDCWFGVCSSPANCSVSFA